LLVTLHVTLPVFYRAIYGEHRASGVGVHRTTGRSSGTILRQQQTVAGAIFGLVEIVLRFAVWTFHGNPPHELAARPALPECADCLGYSKKATPIPVAWLGMSSSNEDDDPSSRDKPSARMK